VVRQARSLLAHRTRLVRSRTAAKNRLQALLFRHNLTPPDGKIFAPAQRDWWEQLPIALSERLRLHQDFALIDHLSRLIAETEQAIAQLSTEEPWNARMPFLVQLPGIGTITGMQILSAIGDVSRFASAKHLVGYAGLGAKVQASGERQWSGGISKQGRVDLRVAVIEAAWAAVRSSEVWRERFERLAQRIGDQKAIVALARKLLVVIWHVLSKKEADRQAQPAQVARKLVRWGSAARVARRFKVSRAAFVRDQLDRIGVGSDLEQLVYKRQVFDLRGPG
jgi:transposase